jgi:general secretion pathway protein G
MHRGFTLIEIMVVVIIIAILAAVVVPNVIGHVNDARISAAMADIKNFDGAIDSYHLDIGSLPPSLDALVSKQAAGNSPKWNGPYLKNQTFIPKDPWGNPYIYKVPGDQGRDYDISSAGSDGQPGTGDDIQSWNLQGHP